MLQLSYIPRELSRIVAVVGETAAKGALSEEGQ